MKLRRAWIFAASVPRTLGRLARQALGRPRTRLVVIATGLPPDNHGEQVELAIAAARERPDRVLVITDRLDFAPFLRAGAGFEHVPAAGERQAELVDGSYADFRARRIALIRARRPRPRRVLELDPRA